MIMGTFDIHGIGEKRLGLTDSKGMAHFDQPYVVLREATEQEYVAECLADGVPPYLLKLSLAKYSKNSRYYEISLD